MVFQNRMGGNRTKNLRLFDFLGMTEKRRAKQKIDLPGEMRLEPARLPVLSDFETPPTPREVYRSAAGPYDDTQAKTEWEISV